MDQMMGIIDDRYQLLEAAWARSITLCCLLHSCVWNYHFATSQNIFCIAPVEVCESIRKYAQSLETSKKVDVLTLLLCDYVYVLSTGQAI